MKIMPLFVKDYSEGERGAVLVIVLAYISLMLITTIFLSSMIKQDVEITHKLRDRSQALYVAEAGINHALAEIKTDGLNNFATCSGVFSTGSYSVRKSTPVSGRILLTSVGTAGSATKTVTAEIEGLLPSALNYIVGSAGRNRIRSAADGVVDINGDVHSNTDTELMALGNNSLLSIDGDVSATHDVIEGSKHYNSDNSDTDIFISGINNDGAVIYEDQPRIVFPVFPYAKYKQEAIDSGDYYSGSKTFNNETVNPGNGIVYVEGNVTFDGDCTLYGGVTADNVKVNGHLTQIKAGDRNIIAARTQDIDIFGDLTVGEAIVYAKRDLRSRSASCNINVNGVIICEREVSFWNVQNNVSYNHTLTYPSDLIGGSGELSDIVSWND